MFVNLILIDLNSSNTELVLFTTKTKCQRFIPHSKSAKYVGIILSWKLNIEYKVLKATVAYYTCHKMFGSSNGCILS